MSSIKPISVSKPAKANLSDAFHILNPEGAAHFLLLCDHASAYIPPAYDGLGLGTELLDRHIACDIGAANVTTALAEKLNAPAVLTNFSRLLIDPNRGLDDPTLIVQLSDGHVIPANRGIDQPSRRDEWQKRVQDFYQPYHQAIERCLARAQKAGVVPIILSIHSFTPVWRGVQRPMQAGILWDKDERLARHLRAALGDKVQPLGDNEPYSGRLKHDTLYRHATLHGFPNALVELRQDTLLEAGAGEKWAQYFVAPMQAAAQDAACQKITHFGSHAD